MMRFIPDKTWRQTGWGLAALALSLLLAEGSYHTPALQSTEHAYSDLWHRLSGIRYTPTHVVLATVDDQSLAQYSDDPLVFWTPLFARACTTLQKAGVSMIGIDFLFATTPEKWLSKLQVEKGSALNNYDQSFRRTLNSGKVLLAASLIKNTPGSYDSLLLPHQDYLLSLPDFDLAAHIGFADLKSDEDGSIRRYEISPPSRLSPELVEGAPQLSLAMLLAVRALGLPANNRAWKISGRNIAAGGEGNISYAGPPGTIPKISFSRLLAEGAEHDPAVQALRGKVVIIGGDFFGMNDVHDTPYSNGVGGALMIGPEIQANIVETLLGDNITTNTGDSVRITLFALLIGLSLLCYRKYSPWAGLGILSMAFAIALLLGWAFFQKFSLFPAAHLQFGLLAAYTLSYGGKLTRVEREKSYVKSVFKRYVADDVVDMLLASDNMPDMGGEKVTITVLFSDIRQFTTISEKLDAHEVVEFLNQYFERLCQPILANGGTIDKFIGDAVMVQFGAPVAYPDHAARAIRTAIAMREVAAEFRLWMQTRFSDKDLPQFDIGIGIHTGVAVVGSIGSSRRTEYTAIGDTVNLASRLESATKTLECTIIASATTIQAAGDGIETGRRDIIQVKGRETAIEIFEVITMHCQEAPHA